MGSLLARFDLAEYRLCRRLNRGVEHVVIRVFFMAASRLGYLQEDLDRSQALAVMDSLAGGEDLVGIVAQFAKARLILLF